MQAEEALIDSENMNPYQSYSREGGVAFGSEDRGDDNDALNDSTSENRTIAGFHHHLGRHPLSPQNSIDEEILRQQEQRRSIRRRRLVIRPAIIFVLGLFVFRSTNNRGFFFHTTVGKIDENNQYQNGLRLPKSSLVEDKHPDNSEYSSTTRVEANSAQKNNLMATTSLFQGYYGNPSVGAYNMVTNMNDDDSNQDIPQSNPGSNNSEDENTTSKRKRRNKTNKDNANNNDNASYGWVPEAYPDPIIDPVRCGIAYLTDENFQTGTIAEEERRGGLDLNALPTAAKTNSSMAEDSDDSSGLRLCDPDWVLGGAYLEEIAQKMQDFSNRFTPRDLGPILPEEQLPTKKLEDQQGLTLAVATVRKVGFFFVCFFVRY